MIQNIAMSHKKAMTIAAAQISVQYGNIAANAVKHAAVMARAAQLGVEVLVFPELSLSGYALDEASDLQISLDDPVLKPLKEIANDAQMLTFVGIPIRASRGGKPLLAAGVFGRDSAHLDQYAKVHVHESEAPYFQFGKVRPVFHHHTLRGGKSVCVGPSICRDLKFPQHAAALAAAGAEVYACGALVTSEAYAGDSTLLASYAEAPLNLNVILANYASKSGDLTPAGKSAVWASGGKQVVAAKGCEECLVIATRDLDGKWHGETVLLSPDECDPRPGGRRHTVAAL